ncbi:hypothetical protein D3C80_863270 [compost metagenome]
MSDRRGLAGLDAAWRQLLRGARKSGVQASGRTGHIRPEVGDQEQAFGFFPVAIGVFVQAHQQLCRGHWVEFQQPLRQALGGPGLLRWIMCRGQPGMAGQ